MIDTDKIDISSLKKAYSIFEKFRANLNSDQEKAGAVQAFEFCYELAWKTMRKILQAQGLEVESPKEAFRQAFVIKLIDNPEIWFEFQRKRNLVSHTYNEKNLDLIVQTFDTFSQELKRLLIKLET